ncbi:MAG: hypothetical protein EPN97_05310 [Alphaproteobacteria bacterium]|nr:MAG: hypothetical protein EPN97_05310 [Alphaproteobacteria bacterium]
MRYTFLPGILALLLLAPVQARAAEVFTMQPTEVRAGPDHHYPLITVAPRNAKLKMAGCTRKYKWCEVVANGLHGWARSKHLAVVQHGKNVRIELYGEALAVPVIVYNEQAYWGRYYRTRDFYITRYVQHTDWRNRKAGSRCFDPGRDKDCHLMVVNRAATVSRPVSEADSDHTRHGSYADIDAGSRPFWRSGTATSTRVSTRANNDYNN